MSEQINGSSKHIPGPCGAMQRRMKCVVIFRRSRGKINAIARRCELSTEPRAGEIQDAAPARSDAAPARLCPRIRTAKATLSTLGGSWSARLAPCRPCSRPERARSRREQPAAPRRDNQDLSRQPWLVSWPRLVIHPGMFLSVSPCSSIPATTISSLRALSRRCRVLARR